MSFDKATIECYNCHKLGHFEWECPNKNTEANYADNQEEMLLMAYGGCQQSQSRRRGFLILAVATTCVATKIISLTLMVFFETL